MVKLKRSVSTLTGVGAGELSNPISRNKTSGGWLGRCSAASNRARYEPQRAALAEGARNHRFGKVHAKVEQVFRIVKRQFGYRKVRYRGIDKKGAQVFSLLALANLYLARRTLASA